MYLNVGSKIRVLLDKNLMIENETIRSLCLNKRKQKIIDIAKETQSCKCIQVIKHAEFDTIISLYLYILCNFQMFLSPSFEFLVHLHCLVTAG